MNSQTMPDDQSDHVPILDFSTYSINSIANHLRSQIILAEIKEIKYRAILYGRLQITMENCSIDCNDAR